MIESAGTKTTDTSAWSNPARRAALLILIVAAIVGTGLRFYRLGVEEMTPDEAAAWTAASAPDLPSVFVASKRLDPGKSGIWNILLHLWIRAVGDSVGQMRTLSALLGSLAILLIFAAVRELFLIFDGERGSDTAWTVAAFAALLYACDLEMITIDRTARMYSLMLVAVLGQLWAFARAHRWSGLGLILSAALCTSLAVAANFTSLFFFAAEAIWLAGVGVSARLSPAAKIATGADGALSVWRPATALILAAVFFLPSGIADAQVSMHALQVGALEWIEPRPPWWPFRALQVMTGNAAFWPTLILAGVGIWYSIRESRAIRFVLCWTVAPFVLLEVVSYAITPILVERYALISLAGYLTLAALGLARIPDMRLRYLVAGIVVSQFLTHVHHHWRNPDDIQWREAARFAIRVPPAGARIAVMPPHGPLPVLKYYLPASEHPRLVGIDATRGSPSSWVIRCGSAPLLIEATAIPPASREQLNACYPHLLKRFRLVEVRGR